MTNQLHPQDKSNILECKDCKFIERHNGKPDFFCSKCGGKDHNLRHGK